MAATFKDLMKLCDQAIAQLRSAPMVYQKDKLRFLVDEALRNPAGLTPAQEQQLEAKRKELEVLMQRHERGN